MSKSTYDKIDDALNYYDLISNYDLCEEGCHDGGDVYFESSRLISEIDRFKKENPHNYEMYFNRFLDRLNMSLESSIKKLDNRQDNQGETRWKLVRITKLDNQQDKELYYNPKNIDTDIILVEHVCGCINDVIKYLTEILTPENLNTNQEEKTHYKKVSILPVPDFYDLKNDLENNVPDLTDRKKEYSRVLRDFNLNEIHVNKNDPEEAFLITDWNFGKRCQIEIDFLNGQIEALTATQQPGREQRQDPNTLQSYIIKRLKNKRLFEEETQSLRVNIDPQSGEPTPTKGIIDHSKLLISLSKFIKEVSDRDFTDIIEQHKLTNGAPKAKWIGTKVSACCFADYINMTYSLWNQCFLLKDSKPLHNKYKDKIGKDSPVRNILETYFVK